MSEAKYRILKELGAGGMGTVCKGLLIGEAGFQRPIVIKQLKHAEPEHLRLFVEEARRYALLDHENIGRIFDFERVRGETCIILEVIEGRTVVEDLDRVFDKRGAVRQLAVAVDVAAAPQVRHGTHIDCGHVAIASHAIPFRCCE